MRRPYGAALSDAACAALSALSALSLLRSLALCGCRISDAGLAILAPDIAALPAALGPGPLR